MRHELNIRPEPFEFQTDIDETEAPFGEFETLDVALPGRTLSYTTRDVIDQRISVPAQHSLVRLSKNPTTSADAVALLAEVKAGRLGGIFCVNWQKPAQRAIRIGKSWWTVIPPGEDAVLMLDPDDPLGGQPLIAFRRELDPDCGLLKGERRFSPSVSRLDAALLKAWANYKVWRGQELTPLEPRCGVPKGVLQALKSRKSSRSQPEMYEGWLEEGSHTVEPKLCLFQNVSSDEGLLFKNQASRWAHKIGALAIPNLDRPSSHPEVGPTPYNTGKNIMSVFDVAYSILEDTPIKEVHIFGHMYPEGLIGHKGNFTGLYRRDPVIVRQRNCSPSGCRVEEKSVEVNRDAGGRVVADIQPLTRQERTKGEYPFAEDVVFVLHGCNTATGNENFARTLYEKLSILQDPKVYGHHTGVCAGQDGCWREYSYRSKTGELRSKTIQPFYQGHGLCSKAVEIAKNEGRCTCCP
jgi:hypothetical protein